MDAFLSSAAELGLAFLQHLLNSVILGLLPIAIIGFFIGWISILLAAKNAGVVDRRAVRAFAIVGATTGLMIGSSRSPIIHVALPALLTLVSTFLAYLYAREKPSEDAEKMLSSLSNMDAKDLQALDAGDRKAIKDNADALKDILGRVQFIPAGILAPALASGGAAFFGASMRAVEELNDRNYKEWLLSYEKIELPINADLLRKKAGLPLKGAEAESDTSSKTEGTTPETAQ